MATADSRGDLIVIIRAKIVAIGSAITIRILIVLPAATNTGLYLAWVSGARIVTIGDGVTVCVDIGNATAARARFRLFRVGRARLLAVV
jgi:hypothetical protein